MIESERFTIQTALWPLRGAHMRRGRQASLRGARYLVPSFFLAIVHSGRQNITEEFGIQGMSQ